MAAYALSFLGFHPDKRSPSNVTDNIIGGISFPPASLLTPLFDNPHFRPGVSIPSLGGHRRADWPLLRETISPTTGQFKFGTLMDTQKRDWLVTHPLSHFSTMYATLLCHDNQPPDFEKPCLSSKSLHHLLSTMHKMF